MSNGVSHFNMRIFVDSKTGQMNLEGFDKSLKNTEKTASNVGQSFSKMGLALAGGIAAIGALAVKAVQGAAELENYATQFEVLTGSAEKGTALFKEIRDLSAVTPFETKDLAASTQTMLGFNIAQEDVIGNLKMLGDISGGNAEKLNSLTLAFSQVQSAGKLTGGDLLQMINAGFNPLTIISEKTGKSMGELRKEMEKGAITADMVKEAMVSATSEGGKYFGMMEKQSKTFQGMLSTLQDTIGMLLAEAGAPFLQLLKELMPVITPIIEALGKALQPVIQSLAATLKSLIPPFMDLLDKIFKALSPVLDLIVSSMGKLTPLFSKLIVAAGKLVEAAMPMIDMFTSLAEEQLDELIPLVDALLDLFIALSPAIQLTAKVTADLMGMGMKFLTTVAWPLRKVIEYIIEFGAQAANLVTSIFGGGDQKKPAKKQAAQGGGGATGPQEGDVSPDGKMVFKGGKWVPIETKPPAPTGGAGKEKSVVGSIPYLEEQVKALEKARDKTKAGSEEWAALTLRIAEAQAKIEMFNRIAESLTGTGPEAKGMSPFKQLAQDVQLFPNTIVPAIDATTTVIEELANSFEELAGVVTNVMGSLAELFNSNFEEMKYVSVAEAVVNTAVGVTKALGQGGWLGIAGAVSVGLAGAAQIKKILSAKPGSSGGGDISGLAQSGGAPTSTRGMMPQRLALSGAQGPQMPQEIKLRAEGGDLVGAMRVNTRNLELAGV